MTVTDSGLARWVRILEPAMMLAEKLSETEFVPKAMRGKPDLICACILYGDEIGIGPMQALANVDVVEGKPRQSAALMRAMVKQAGHHIEILTLNDKVCRVRAHRRGEAPGPPIEWTLQMARSAGLLNKMNWQRYPRAMLLARATSEACTIEFPDVVRGLDVGDDESTALGFNAWADQIAPSPHGQDIPTGATIKRLPAWVETAQPGPTVEQQLGQPVDDVPLPQEGSQEAPDSPQEGPPGWDGPDDLPPAPDSPPEAPSPGPPPLPPEHRERVPDVPIGQALLRAVLAGFDRIGCTDRALRLAISRAVVNRPLETSKDLTRREGLKLVRVLSELETGTLQMEIAPDGAVQIFAPDSGEMANAGE